MSTTYLVLILSALAGGMVLTTGALLKWAAFARTGFRAAVVLFLMVMMTGMLVGAAVYLLTSGPSGLILGFWVASIIMSASAVLVFFQFLREAQVRATAEDAPTRKSLSWSSAFFASIVTTALLNEFLMGWTFQRAAGGPILLGGGGVVNLFAHVLVSPWFVFPMALEMAIAIAWLRAAFPRAMRWLLVIQPIIMVCSPPVLTGTGWVVGSAVGASAAMALAIGYLLVLVNRNEILTRSVMNYATQLLCSIALMAGGLGFWAATGNVTLFSLSVLAQMVVFLYAVIAPERYWSTVPGVSPFPAPPDSAGSSAEP